MVGGPVRELRCRNVQNPLPCSFGDHVDKAQKVLAAVPETHAAAHTALEVGGASAHVEGHHALVLVPDVYHSVKLLVICLYLDSAQKFVPVFLQFQFCLSDLIVSVVSFDHFLGSCPVDLAQAFPFLFFGVLDVTKTEGDRVLLVRLESDVQLMGSAGSPAVGYGIA